MPSLAGNNMLHELSKIENQVWIVVFIVGVLIAGLAINIFLEWEDV